MAPGTKQVSKRNTVEQLQIGVNAIDPTQLSEAKVLMMILCLYQLDNLQYDARTAIAQFLGCSEMHISHCVSGSAKLGDEAWGLLVSRCGQKAHALRNAWLQELERRYPNSHS